MNKPLRILHIVGVMDQGGIETLLMNLYRNIDRSIIQFDFLTHSNKKGFYDDEIHKLGGRIYSIVSPFSIKGIFTYKKELLIFFNQHQEYTIVHSHMNTFSGMILSVAKQANIPIRIAHSHTTIAASRLKTPLWKLSRKFGQKSITHFFACSKDAAFWSFGKYANKTYIFKNAIDLEQYKFNNNTRKLYREKLEIQENFVIGHVGRFNEIKNHKFLINIFYELFKEKQNSTLILIGDGPLIVEIKQKVEELDIAKHVKFLGNRNDVAKLLCAMDIFVLPSINEGLGMVAIEAQASGLPCFVSDTLPKEVKVSPILEFISLKKEPNYWAFKILSKPIQQERTKTYLEVKKAGYDIKESAKWLMNFYLNTSTKR